MTNTITVSGVGIPDGAIPFPSGQIPFGQPGANLYAFLAGANASFGFNMTPNSLEMDFVPVPRNEPIFHGASGNLPSIGTFLEMFIGDFIFRGRVQHADYQSTTSQGTIVKVSLKDDRHSLDGIKIHTEDLGENIPSGVVSIGRAYRLIHGLTDDSNSAVDALVFEYNKIATQGATYSQIIDALQLAINEGQINFSINQIPSTEQLEANIGGAIEALRFKFNMTTVTQVITTILQDSGYDWYWNMTSQQVNLVNKKAEFNISEDNILTLLNEATGYSDVSVATKRLSYGQDAVSEPTKFRLLGGRQQGIINSNLLSPIDGLDTSALDGNVIFYPAWKNISIGFYDSGGYYRTYMPTDKELQMALAGIEQWSYFKIYQTESANDGGFDLSEDEGSKAAQHEDFRSRFDPLETLADIAGDDSINNIRVIDNRRDEAQNWTIDFYGRINNHAQRHFGRSYIALGIVYNEASGLFMPVDSAWCNVENQIDGQLLSASGSIGPFPENYKINTSLGPISPFVANDWRVSAHVVLPADTTYGVHGDQAPASFTEWTEDAPPFNPDGDGKHYVPCTLQVVGKRIVNPRSSTLYGFEDYPDGTLWVQLPIIAGITSQDGVLANLATLIEMSKQLNGKGLFDLVDPTILMEPYSSLTGVAIPVESRVRYGQTYPSSWALGELHYQKQEKVTVDESFVPWNFYPIANDTSLTVMTDSAVRRVQGQYVTHLSSRYADVEQVGLPTITFDSFADQGINASGQYGVRKHGITEMNLTFGKQGYTARYKIASYFASFGKEASLGERSRVELDGILHPIDFTSLGLTNPSPPSSLGPPPAGDTPYLPFPFGEKKTAVKVTITQVNDIFTMVYASNPSSGPIEERYRGTTETGDYEKPPTYAGDEDFVTGAICVDGFLNHGDEALYHMDEFEYDSGVGSRVVYRYFTAGRAFGNGSIVNIVQVNADDSTKYDVVLDGGLSRAIIGAGVLGGGSASIGDTTTLVTNSDANVKPGNAASGLFIQASAGASVPVEIISIDNPGTSGAFAYARKINSYLQPDNSQALTSGIPFPFPSHARVGDQGLLASTADGKNAIFIARIPLGAN